MAHHNQNGGRNVAVPDENRPSWRPQDQTSAQMRNRGNDDDHDYRSWRDRNYRDDDRDPQRWEGSRGSELGYGEDREFARSTERYGQGQSGYSAGRYGDDRSQHLQNRNEWAPANSGASYEDRYRDFGTDDRFSRGEAPYWADRTGYEPQRYGAQGGRGFEAERRGADQRGYDQRGYDQRMGYQGGQGRGSQHDTGYPSGSSSLVRGSQEVGYHGGFGRDTDARPDAHVHRGTGPHRGKGPMGYQRSDERLRELVCEALADDDQIDASQIHVAVKDGEVTLTGVVESRRIKREAEDCVSNVSGVRDVQIQIRIRDEASQRWSPSQPGNSMHGGPTASSTASGSGAMANRDNGASSSTVGKSEPETSNQDKKHRA